MVSYSSLCCPYIEYTHCLYNICPEKGSITLNISWVIIVLLERVGNAVFACTTVFAVQGKLNPCPDKSCTDNECILCTTRIVSAGETMHSM